jgi:predicted  nucleic acid-binding Zn-ribbon protein
MENKHVSPVEALRQAHVALLEDLTDLENAANSYLGTDSAAMLSRLERTRTHITEHFRFEEQNGYMADVLQREPNLARTIEQLRDEHHKLALKLDGLLEQMRSGQPLEEAVRDQVRSWIESVRQHEARENSLVQYAFNVDLGAED